MKTAVIGASGYAGGELLRLLATHPVFEVTVVSAYSNAGEQVTSVHPQLQSYAGRVFVTADSIDFSTIDLVFLALPHGESAALIAKIPAAVKIVDLGADYRLEDPVQWEKYYGGKHAGSMRVPGFMVCQSLLRVSERRSKKRARWPTLVAMQHQFL